MRSKRHDDQNSVLGEAFAEELKVITEYVKDVPSLHHDIREIKQTVTKLQSDMQIVKAVVTDISQEQKSHERRLAQIEAS